MKKIILIFLISNQFVIAQKVEPSKSTEEDILSAESEVFYANGKSGGIDTKSWNLFNMLFRYGLSNNMELNLALSNAREKVYENNLLVNHHHKFDNLKTGLLYNVYNNTSSTEVALQLDFFIPLDKEHHDANKVGFLTGLNVGTQLLSNWLLSYNVGYFKNVDWSDNYYYNINLQYQFNDNMVFFTENTGEYTDKLEWNQGVGLGYNTGSWSFEAIIGKGSNYTNLFTGFKIIKNFDLKKEDHQLMVFL